MMLKYCQSAADDIDLTTALVALWVIVAHWYADFVCQTHWQASNKSKNWSALTRHVTSYTVVVGILIGWEAQGWAQAALFVAITFAAHFLTDAVTSRITSRLYAKQDWHNFFVVIGLDQVLHYVQLFLTLAFVTRFQW
jgi:hypothetical protein